MNADREQELWNACREWRRLAEAEGDSISSRNWPLVADCQQVLEGLQPQITRLLGEVRAQWRQSGQDAAGKERRLREVLEDLIRLGRNNAAQLDRLRLDSLEQHRQLDLSARNLKRIQHSYNPVRAPEWCSVS